MLLLALTFILWGVGDMLRQNSDTPYIVKVGNQEVYQPEWEQILHQNIQELKKTYGKSFSEKDVNQKVFRQAILGKIINRSMLFQESQKLGILVSDEMVKYEIASQPTFQGKDGKFSKEVFSNFIQQSGLTESRFLEAMKEDMAISHLIHPFTFYNLPSPQFLDQVNYILNAERELEFYEINQNKIQIETQPTTKELEQILTTNQNKFSIPETRLVNYISFSIKDIDQKVDITEEELEHNYKSKLFLFTKPETRTISHLIFQELDQALAAKKQIDAGENFESVGTSLKARNKDTFLGELTQEGFDKEIADVIFNLKLGEPSRPVQSPLGFHVFKVTKITPKKTASYNEVKDSLRKQFTEEKLFERLSQLAQQIDNDIANNTPLAEIALKYKLNMSKANASNNKTFNEANLTSSTSFITTALNTDLNTISMVTPFNDETFFTLQVEGIKPQKLKSLADAKAELVQFWQDEKKAKLAENISTEIVKSLKSNTPLSNSLLKFVASKKVKINRKNTESLPHEFLDMIYKLKVNDSTINYKDENKYLIAKLTKLNFPTKEQLNKGMSELQGLYAQSQPDITMTEYLNSIRENYKVKTNDELLNQYK